MKRKFKDALQFVDMDTFEEEQESSIVKRKNITIRPMDEEEAVLQMELTDHDFYIFKNIDTDSISVVYKRKDETYGIINV